MKEIQEEGTENEYEKLNQVNNSTAAHHVSVEV